MTTTNEQKPNSDTRYVKQEALKGDFAAGERTTLTLPEVENFASGEQTLPASTAVGDFASGEHTQPIVPENPALVDTLPSVPVAIDHKE